MKKTNKKGKAKNIPKYNIKFEKYTPETMDQTTIQTQTVSHIDHESASF